MNEHQRAGLRSVWEMYRIILLLIGVLALVAGVSYAVFRVTQSTGWAVGVGLVLVYGSVYGWITRDIYRMGVNRSKREAEHEATMASLREKTGK